MASKSPAQEVRFPTAAGNVHIARGRCRSEGELRAAIVHYLTNQGVVVASRVVCMAGEPDIISVNRDLIIEVKWLLSKKAICTALGQILLYREAIDPRARLVIVGYATTETLALLPLIASLGIEIVCWPNGWLKDVSQDLGKESKDAEHIASNSEIPAMKAVTSHDAPFDSSQHMTLLPQTIAAIPRSLKWNVAILAEERGIMKVPQLAVKTETNRQGLYSIWRGTAAQVSLDILGRLAWTLGVEPGDWFSWDPTFGNPEWNAGHQSSSSRPRLLWKVALKAELQGFDAVQLSFRAGIYLNSMMPIWTGAAQAISLATLAKIALALHSSEQSFDIGRLFIWDA